MYPQERELAARHARQPFALVSVNTDPSVDSLRQSIARGEITWRCWWDGGMTGPITTRWGILSFPSIFVLDRAGVIRFKDVRGDELDRAVTSLLDEAAGKNPARRYQEFGGCIMETRHAIALSRRPGSSRSTKHASPGPASSTWRHRSFPDLPEGPCLDLGPLLLAQV